MRLHVFTASAILVMVGAIHAQSAISTDAVLDIPHDEIIRHVFDGERATIAAFAKGQPIVETYLQSLDPETIAEAPIDDAYFLGRVDLNADSPDGGINQTLLFGNTDRDRRVRVSNGQRWPLTPDGFVSMLFPDINNFDEDDYELKTQNLERLGNTNCVRFLVSPKNPKLAGYFVGDIWVETSHFRIVRIKGTFTPKRFGFFAKYFDVRGISYLGMYLHFDSWREEAAPGIWVPSYTYFDENRTWGNATGQLVSSFRYRGHVLAWGYQGPPADLGQAPATDQTARTTGSLLARLQSDGLLANPGEVEASLTGIVRELRAVNNLGGPEVDCRVLLTTPVELFSVESTVFISRGLLNLAPGHSVLTVLLATELAHILLGHSQGVGVTTTSLFSGRTSDFGGFGIRRTVAEEAAAANRVKLLLNHPQYANAISETDAFLSQLALQSSQIPNLVRARFGLGLVMGGNSGVKLPIQESGRQQPSATPLALWGTYGVESLLNRVAIRGDSNGLEDPARLGR